MTVIQQFETRSCKSHLHDEGDQEFENIFVNYDNLLSEFCFKLMVNVVLKQPCWCLVAKVDMEGNKIRGKT